MKIKLYTLLFFLGVIVSCKKNSWSPYGSPGIPPITDSLPFESAHLKIELVSNQAPHELSDIEFIDQNLGFGTDDRYGKIYRTTDGGLSWIESYTPSGSNVYLRDVEFLDQNTGVAVGSDYSTDPVMGLILKTSDGGITWTIVKEFSSVSIWNVSIIDSLHSIAGGLHFIPPSSFANYALQSSDGGETWIISDSVNDILKVTHNSDYCFGLGDRGKIFRSTDFGISWSQVADLNFLNDANEISFFQNTGYSAYTDTIFKTIDDGMNWQKIPLPNEVYTFIRKINPLSTESCLFFGLSGYLDYDLAISYCAVVQTIDAGASFEKTVTFSNIGSIQATSFYDDHHGYATDHSGNLLRVTVK